MPQSHSPVPAAVAEAEALIQKIQQDFDAATEFYRSTGIDPDKVLTACEPFMGERERQELQQAIERDQAEVQREVDEGAARQRFSAAPKATPGGVPKRPRNMI